MICICYGGCDFHYQHIAMLFWRCVIMICNVDHGAGDDGDGNGETRGDV